MLRVRLTGIPVDSETVEVESVAGDTEEKKKGGGECKGNERKKHTIDYSPCSTSSA